MTPRSIWRSRGLNLADWKPFLGDIATTGNVGLKLKVSSHQGGKQIGFDLNTDVANLTARLGSNQISQAEITLAAHGQAAEFKQITLSDYRLQVALQNQPALTVSGSGNYDLATGDADAQVKLPATLARLLAALPQPGMSISSGDVELNARVTQKQKTQTVTGDLSLANFRRANREKSNFSVTAASSSSTWPIRRNKFKSTRWPAASARMEIPAAILIFPGFTNPRRNPPT